jgi:hypothetical protein
MKESEPPKESAGVDTANIPAGGVKRIKEIEMKTYSGNLKLGEEIYPYAYRDSWGKRYYSFDGERNWETSKRKAFEQAEKVGRLRKAGEVRVTVIE